MGDRLGCECLILDLRVCGRQICFFLSVFGILIIMPVYIQNYILFDILNIIKIRQISYVRTMQELKHSLSENALVMICVLDFACQNNEL